MQAPRFPPVPPVPLPLLGLLLLGSLALAGCGGDGDARELPPEWRGRDLDEPGWSEATLRPGWGLGVEYVWSSGKDVEWDWLVNGSAVLHFKVVRIEGGQAQTLVVRFANESAAGLTVPQGGVHQILWRNEGPADVNFWHRLPEGGLVRSYGPSEGPDCTVRVGPAPSPAPRLC